MQITRGQQRALADYLDEIATEKLTGVTLDPDNPMTRQRLALGAAYRLVAGDMRSLADGENRKEGTGS